MVFFQSLESLNLLLNSAPDRYVVVFFTIKRDFLHFDLENLKEFGVWIESSRGSVEGHHRKLKIFELNR